MILKRRAVFIGLAVLILAVAAFAVKTYLDDRDREPSLSIRQAVKILAGEGIQLNKTSDPEAQAINGVKPVTYLIGDTGNKLHIYHYHSIAERKTASDMYRGNAGEHFYSTPNNTAKNLLLTMELTDKKEMTSEDLETVGKIYRAVFEKLNDTEEIIYTGTGSNWSSETTVKYYEYFYKGEKATLRYESWHKESTSLKYLGDDMESVGVITYEMKSAGGGGSGTGPTLNSDGTVKLGSSGGNGAIPRADQEITFIIKWNDREETFTAKANGQASD